MSVQLSLSRLSEPLKLWERIEIVVGEGEHVGKYTSRIEDFRGSSIYIAAPEFVSGNKRLTNNCTVYALVARADATYRFACTITRSGEDKTTYMLLEPRHVERVQRRMFYRIELLTKVAYQLLADYEKPEEPPAESMDEAEESDRREGERARDQHDVDNDTWQTTSALDISGGGILIKTEKGLPPGTLVLLRIEFLVEQDLPEIIAGVCRRTGTKDGHACTGIEFVRSDQLSSFTDSKTIRKLPDSVREFDQKAQNRLVTAIFYKQVEFRRKGVLG